MAIKHIFIIGAKGFTYGGYETFLDKLTEYHKDLEDIKYHIACKKNGQGITNFEKLQGAVKLSKDEYEYHNAHCFLMWSPPMGAAQAILYDLVALRYCIRYIKRKRIEKPIIYILSSRIGPFMGFYAKKIHALGGFYFNNPDGRESLRRKYKPIVRKYWKRSEQGMVKYSDLVICDSKHIEEYIKREYKQYKPYTTYIAYGSDLGKSCISDDDELYQAWLRKHGLKDGEFYLSVGRFVPENNFETMIREFMKSKTEKDFVLITNTNIKLLKTLENKLHFSQDRRIRFVGTVYDKQLLKKIRENAFGYFHGHEVGGTNPSLLEALSSTRVNLLYDVGYNKEVAGNAALYWNKSEGDLAMLIDKVDIMDKDTIFNYGEEAKKRISENYSWQFIADEYLKVWSGNYSMNK